jgi:hypothetical protein
MDTAHPHPLEFLLGTARGKPFILTVCRARHHIGTGPGISPALSLAGVQHWLVASWAAPG